MRSLIESGMPVPVSVTSIVADAMPSVRCPRLSVIMPPSGMACMALISRLSSTCWIWPLWPSITSGWPGGSNDRWILFWAILSLTSKSVSSMISARLQRECRSEGALAKPRTRVTMPSSWSSFSPITLMSVFLGSPSWKSRPSPPCSSLSTVSGLRISWAISAARSPKVVRRSRFRRDSSLLKTRA